MNRNYQVEGSGDRNYLEDRVASEFSRSSVDTGANGNLDIDIEGLRSVDEATIQADDSSYKAAVVPGSGNTVTVVILNDSDNTPETNSSDVTDISGVAYGE